jgi:hypothetical protein
MYADDTHNYLHFNPNEIEGAIVKVQTCFADLQTWMNSNKLVLNASKTETIILGLGIIWIKLMFPLLSSVGLLYPLQVVYETLVLSSILN